MVTLCSFSILPFSKKPCKASQSCHHLMMVNYDKICSHIHRLLSAKNSHQVNQVLLVVLPSLVSMEPERFARRNLITDTINYMIGCIKVASLKSLAFISLGLFSIAIRFQSECDQHLSTILKHIRASFPPPSKESVASMGTGQTASSSSSLRKSRQSSQQPPDSSVFTCLAFIAQAGGSKVKPDILTLLPSMFQLGLTEPLANSLYNICKYIGELEDDINFGLLRILSIILMDKPFIIPRSLCENYLLPTTFAIGPLASSVSANITIVSTQGTPSPSGTLSHSASALFHGASGAVSGGGVGVNATTSSVVANSGAPPTEYDLDTVKLALKVLGRFRFQPQYVIHFIVYCSKNYLAHDNREIRLEAVLTVSQLLKPFLKPKSTIESITKDALSRLLLVGITDTDRHVRYSVLSRLDEQFDYYLAQAENLEILQIALNDEVFEIRELAICIMGRLCSLNPAYVMPFLR